MSTGYRVRVDPATLVSAEFGAAVASITDSSSRRDIALRAATEAARRVGILEVTAVASALDPGGPPGGRTGVGERVRRLAEDFDRAADEAEAAGDEARYDDLFGKARAATAVHRYASASPDGNLSDVLYETFHAIEDLDVLWELIRPD